MLLTKKDLEKYQKNMKVTLPDNLMNELLAEYGSTVTDEEGHIFEYTEQDIHEQIRKVIQKYFEGGDNYLRNL